MKYLASALLLAWSTIAIANVENNTFTLTIENDESTVSPGGELRFKMVGSVAANHPYGYQAQFKLDTDGINSERSPRQMNWGSTTQLNHPRYNRIIIKSNITTTLPATVRLIAYRKKETLASATFYIKDGTHGHNHHKLLPSGHWSYVVEVPQDGGHKHYWRIFCISSQSGKCAFKVINANGHDKYKGSQPWSYHNGCSEERMPIQQLGIRETMVFDISTLSVNNADEPNPPFGYLHIKKSYCLIYSTGPFAMELVDYRHLAKPTP